MKNVPNLITCLNLIAGCMACIMALQSNFIGAFVFVALAAVFDFLDGAAARLLNAYSVIGKELDSLCDVVSFGVAPGCIVYTFLLSCAGETVIPFIALLLPVFAALRLAKFNVDTRQTTSFLGLPVPAMGLFWASLIPSVQGLSASCPIGTKIGIGILIILFCWLMVSEIPMFSLKFKNLKWKDNRWSFSLILIAIGLFFLFLSLGIPLLSVALTILAYIIMSLVKLKMQNEK
jgi:CDP-diacylglycerol--serine O-phosphatidyltransferase